MNWDFNAMNYRMLLQPMWAKKLVLWGVLFGAISIVFLWESWKNAGTLLSQSNPETYGVYHWGVLGLCFLWVWLKRKDIQPKLEVEKISLTFVFLGVALLGLALLLPSSERGSVFQILLAGLGVFALLFGQAVVIPSILLGIYGFTLLFPTLISRFAESQFAGATAWTVAGIFKGIGFPITQQGQAIQFSASSGETISTFVNAGCAGHATMGVFVALFALMMLDVKLPMRKASYMFLVGVIGTWLQNILRILIVIVLGYYWGPDILEKGHQYLPYFMFPAWYAAFAYLYLRQAERR